MADRDAALFREGDRCGACGYWWWPDGLWHSLVPITYADSQGEANLTCCPMCAESMEEGPLDVAR